MRITKGCCLQRYLQRRWLFSNSAFPKKPPAGMPPEAIPAGDSHSQPMGHSSVEQWNCTSQIMERPGTVRLAALLIVLLAPH